MVGCEVAAQGMECCPVTHGMRRIDPQKYEIGMRITDSEECIVADVPDNVRIARLDEQRRDEIDVRLIVICDENGSMQHRSLPS
jgi:hypothetical protein